jgi:hypothetical protein
MNELQKFALLFRQHQHCPLTPGARAMSGRASNRTNPKQIRNNG